MTTVGECPGCSVSEQSTNWHVDLGANLWSISIVRACGNRGRALSNDVTEHVYVSASSASVSIVLRRSVVLETTGRHVFSGAQLLARTRRTERQSARWRRLRRRRNRVRGTRAGSVSSHPWISASCASIPKSSSSAIPVRSADRIVDLYAYPSWYISTSYKARVSTRRRIRLAGTSNPRYDLRVAAGSTGIPVGLLLTIEFGATDRIVLKSADLRSRILTVGMRRARNSENDAGYDKENNVPHI